MKRIRLVHHGVPSGPAQLAESCCAFFELLWTIGRVKVLWKPGADRRAVFFANYGAGFWDPDCPGCGVTMVPEIEVAA